MDAVIKQYLSGWEVILDGQTECKSFIKTQLVDERTAKTLSNRLELTFGPDKRLIDVQLIVYDEVKTKGYFWERLRVEEAIGQLTYVNWPVNQFYELIENPNGSCYFGGSVPSEFELPVNKCPGSFQYLGMISSDDLAFQWLPFDLHLTCPIYLDFTSVWVDYKNPLKPVLFNQNEVNNAGSSYGDLNADSYILFEKKKFKSEKIIESDLFGIGMSGVPSWIQYPDIPICPKSGEPLNFVCQWGNYAEVGVVKTNIRPKNELYNAYFENMTFRGSGDLFVFLHPKTRMACYIIQTKSLMSKGLLGTLT